MIDDWRSKWFYGTDDLTDPEFPFGFVQVSNENNFWINESLLTTVHLPLPWPNINPTLLSVDCC